MAHHNNKNNRVKNTGLIPFGCMDETIQKVLLCKAVCRHVQMKLVFTEAETSLSALHCWVDILKGWVCGIISTLLVRGGCDCSGIDHQMGVTFENSAGRPQSIQISVPIAEPWS
jgi:hypothetical protein